MFQSLKGIASHILPRVLHGKSRKMLFFSRIWPEPTASAAGVRTMALLERAVMDGFKVEFCTAARTHLAPVKKFDELGVKVLSIPSVNNEGINPLLASSNPDVVVFDRYISEETFGWRVKQVCPHALQVLDTQDLHFLRRAREAIIFEFELARNESFRPEVLRKAWSSAKGPKWKPPAHHRINMPALDNYIPVSHYQSHAAQNLSHYLKYYPQFAQDLMEMNPVECSKHLDLLHVSGRHPYLRSEMTREIAAIHRSDITLIVSDVERYLLEKVFGVDSSKLDIAPFYCDVHEETWKPRDTKHGYCMLGHFEHMPNRDAIQWMVQCIWPLIRSKQPDATLDIFGAHPQEKDMLLSDPANGVRVLGPLSAEALLPRLSKYRVHLAPLRYGAGIKGKICDNWLVGNPTVTTDIGAEGMMQNNDPDYFGGIIANNEYSFAEGAVKLYHDEELWTSLRLKGKVTVETLFDWKTNGNRFSEIVKYGMENLQDIRINNFERDMLNFSELRYTEMLGRYVETKEQLIALQKSIQEGASSVATGGQHASSPATHSNGL